MNEANIILNGRILELLTQSHFLIGVLDNQTMSEAIKTVFCSSMLIQITNGETLIVLISIHIFVKLMLVSSFFSNKSIPLCLFLFLLRLIKTHLSTGVFSVNTINFRGRGNQEHTIYRHR